MAMPLGHRVPLEARIARHAKRAVNGCLEWVSYVPPHGYPMLNIDGSMRRVSRTLWAHMNGPIPHGLLVMHKYDNPRCVEISHLVLGTHKDNTQDMLAKNRCAVGERAGASKLTKHQVLAIRSSTGMSTEMLATCYLVSKSQIRRIRGGHYWRDI